MDYINGIDILNENNQFDNINYIIESNIIQLNESVKDTIKNSIKKLKDILKSIYEKIIKFIKEKLGKLKREKVTDNINNNINYINKFKVEDIKRLPLNNLRVVELNKENYNRLVFASNVTAVSGVKNIAVINKFSNKLGVSDNELEVLKSKIITKLEDIKNGNDISLDINDYFVEKEIKYTDGTNENSLPTVNRISKYKSDIKTCENEIEDENKNIKDLEKDYATLNGYVNGLEKAINQYTVKYPDEEPVPQEYRNLLVAGNICIQNVILRGKFTNTFIAITEKRIKYINEFLERVKNIIKQKLDNGETVSMYQYS